MKDTTSSASITSQQGYTLLTPHYIDHMHYYSKVPAFLQVVDIAGLVKGAHEGQGLGNAFLSHIGACDAIFHVVSKSPLDQNKE